MSNARFSILQARAVRDTRITDSQFRTLAALGMYADADGWCFPLLSTLGKDLGKSKQAVGRDTIALRKLGYLEVRNRFDERGYRRSSLYRLKFDLEGPCQPSIDSPSTSGVDSPSTSGVDVNDPVNAPVNPGVSFPEPTPTKKKGDIFDGMAFYEKQAKERGVDKVEDLLVRLGKGIGVNIPRSVANQSVAKRLLKEESEGRTLDQFLTWLRSDEWRMAHLYIYADPEKVWTIWPQAFVAPEKEDRPEYRKFKFEDDE